jgi:hypothetical protein
MKASRVEFGNPHVYIELGNMVLKAPKDRVTKLSKQIILWISGKPLVFETQ